MQKMKELGIQNPLEGKLHDLLDRRRANSTLRNLTLNSHKVDFSSNDFLSLSTNASLKTAYFEELQKFSLPIGSGGSRLLDGNSSYAENLEKAIAEFHGAKSGLLFNSGFDANAGFFACVSQKGDVVVYDELIHASVHDGMKLSRAAQTIPFKHNCVWDLKSVLNKLLEEKSLGERLKTGQSHVFVAVEAVYSMDGDLAPLLSIVETVERTLPKGTGYIVVDEAHATGVLGPQGRGLVSQLGLENRIFARLHTFGKALACNGAIILGSPILRHYLINYARPLIYTTFMSYPSLSAIRTSYSFLQAGKTEKLATTLQFLIRDLFGRLQAVETPAFKAVLRLPTECPQSPIFSIQLDEPKALAKFLQERGMMVRAVVPPTVPEGTSRVRVCLHAGNTVEDIEGLVRAMEEWSSEVSQTVTADPGGLKRDGKFQARL
ncbi:8-amino-7-oxononanoate synthase-like protein [Byssothecium circinans]|uniref:8-amino-7-oxononanoate synthase-like protein n=1 Tax=Byssothecium circinans TaxID=147558 RepID=A0A6A5TWC1_9PLEO|nr:8-amino-7-oxononanoate synthase-like protein [Byssothecium circinans]